MKTGREKGGRERERSGGPHEDVEGHGESEEERGWGTSILSARMAGNVKEQRAGRAGEWDVQDAEGAEEGAEGAEESAEAVSVLIDIPPPRRRGNRQRRGQTHSRTEKTTGKRKQQTRQEGVAYKPTHLAGRFRRSAVHLGKSRSRVPTARTETSQQRPRHALGHSTGEEPPESVRDHG